MDKKIIEIFMPKEELNNQPAVNRGGSSCRCDCGCCCGSARSSTISELVERFSQKYDSVGEFKINKLTVDTEEVFISRLNKVLLDSCEKLVVSKANLDFVLSKVAPLIAVAGKVISVKNYPDEEQLYNAIKTGKKIPMKPSCC